MPSIEDFMGFTTCLVSPAAAEETRTWISIDVASASKQTNGNDWKVHSATAVDSLLEATATSRRRSVSFSEELDVLTFHVADDHGEASAKLVTADDAGGIATDAGTSGDRAQKKKRRSISFDSNAETSTFEVFTDMTPTRDMCDELMLKLQEEEKQKEALKPTAAIEEETQPAADSTKDLKGVRQPCIKSSQTSRGPARRVSFEEEPEIFMVGVAEEEETCIDTLPDMPRLSLEPEATNWNLQVLMKDASRITVSPCARRYLLNMRSLMGEYPTVVVAETGTIAREDNSYERCDTAVQVLKKLVVVPQSDADIQASSIKKALALYWQRTVETNLSWM